MAQQDAFWASPTVRSVLMALITALLGALIWFFQWFAGHFDSRMARVESDIQATKTVVITLAIKQGVSFDTLTVAIPPAENTVPKEKTSLAFVPIKSKATLQELLVR